MSAKPTASGSITVNATPQRVYDLVSDPKTIVEFAAETFKVFTVGSRWVGINRNKWHVWPTFTKITQSVPGQVFEFEVGEFGVPVSRWRYSIEPVENGAQVTESTWDRRPAWFIKATYPFTGVKDRVTTNTANIETTLRQLKAIAEA